MVMVASAWVVLTLPGLGVACSKCEREEPRDLGGNQEEGVPPLSTAWQSRGLSGGGALFSPAISPHSRGEIVMSSDMTGVYRTTDYGRRWRLVPSRVLVGSERTQLRFTSDPQVLYALDSPQTPPAAPRLVKSTDGGSTWDSPITTPGTPGEGYYLFVDPESTERLIFSDLRHLYFSRDGGRTFSDVYSSSWDGGLVVGGAVWAGADIYVGTSDGILVSRDQGAHFSLDSALGQGIPVGERIVSFAGARKANCTRFFAVTFETRSPEGAAGVRAGLTGGERMLFAGLYRLTLGESGWVRSSSGIGAGDKLAFVGASFHDVDVAYAAGGNDGSIGEDQGTVPGPVVLKTTDGGRSWRHVFLTEGNANIATGWSGKGGDMDWSFGDFILGLGVSPKDARVVAITDLGFVHVTQDGGKSWQQAYVDPRDQNRMGRDTPKSRFYRSNGVEQTSGWWLTWSSPKTLFASLTDVRSAFSTNGGASWTRDGRNGLTLNTTYHVVRHPKTGTLYAATSSVHDIYQSAWMRDARLDGTSERPALGAVMASSNSGASWTLVQDLRRPVVWLALDPKNPNRLYASVVSSSSGGVYRFDLEKPRQPAQRLPAPPRTKGHPYNVHVLRDGSIVATYSGHQDGNSRVFAERSGVFWLPSGADGWEDRSAPEMRFWTKDIVIDPQNESRWYVGVFSHDARDFGGLYRTLDRGLTWQRIGFPRRVESCAIDPKNPDRMYMTTEDEGLWVSGDRNADSPTFRWVEDYPFLHPMRVFWNPFDPSEVWSVSFGGGVHAKREPALVVPAPGLWDDESTRRELGR